MKDHKICSKCLRDLNLKENFYELKTGRFASWCKDCSREYGRTIYNKIKPKFDNRLPTSKYEYSSKEQKAAIAEILIICGWKKNGKIWYKKGLKQSNGNWNKKLFKGCIKNNKNSWRIGIKYKNGYAKNKSNQKEK